MIRGFFVISFYLIGSICSVAYSGASIDSQEKAECEKNKGRWVTPPSQILNREVDIGFCVFTTDDAGKVCESSQQCSSGVCTSATVVKRGEKVVGECFEWSNPIGHCLVTVENGIVTGEICFD